MTRKTLPIFIIITLLMVFSSCTCIYFNTFHNVRKNFNTAEKSRSKAGRDEAKGAETKQYSDAINKASGVLERHPNSSWVDDALYIIGTSYYYLGDYGKGARKFKELLANYPESEFVARSRLLLAKSRLKMREETEAIVIFEEIFDTAEKREMKAEAARSLGEYFFELGDYETANKYFLSLIDSLGESFDKLRAYMYVADGYFEKFNFKEAQGNYENAMGENPDTLQAYAIEFRMAECDYFLFNIEGGLERLQDLADNELYYDSLAPIRLKMAEGFEWEGDIESAISTYEQITIENARKEEAALAYYELALIYQYDFEDLVKAREFYEKARDEKRGSSVFEDATKRASRLILLEEYSQSDDLGIQPDSSEVLDMNELHQLAENQFLLGELFYLDLDKPDSALNAFSALLEHYPQTRYAPRALLSMAYIYKHDFQEAATGDSLLRQVLNDYARYDEAEDVINQLGLSGTIADSGYAAIVFQKAENFLVQFQGLERQWYFPFEVRYIAPIDTTSDSTGEASTSDEQVVDLDESLAEDSTEGESVFVPNPDPKDDVPIRYNQNLTEIMADNKRIEDSIQASLQETVNEQKNIERMEKAKEISQSNRPVNPEVLDTLGNKIRGMDTSTTSIRLTDLLKGETPPELDSLREQDSLPQGMVVDSLPEGIPENILDSVFADQLPSGEQDSTSAILDSSLVPVDSQTTTELSGDNPVVDDSLAIDSTDTLFVDPDIPVDTVARTDKYYAALDLIDSARYYYQYVIDTFPFSDYNVQAQYLMLWTYDKYFAPGDSNLIDLYASFVDSFPQSPYTEYIIEEYKIRPSVRITQKQTAVEEEEEEEDEEDPDQDQITDADSTVTDESGLAGTAEYSFIVDEDGKVLQKANEYRPSENLRFEYPLEALPYRIEPKLYFQIRIDFNGEVDEVKLMNPTDVDELNERIILTVEQTKFDAGLIPPALYDQWFYYTRQIKIPQDYRQ